MINLLPNKKRVFEEAFRILKVGGYNDLDFVLLKELPDFIKEYIEEIVGRHSCLPHAISKDEYLGAIKEAGFQDVEVVNETYS